MPASPRRAPKAGDCCALRPVALHCGIGMAQRDWSRAMTTDDRHEVAYDDIYGLLEAVWARSTCLRAGRRRSPSCCAAST